MAVVQVLLCIDVCVGRDEELAHVHETTIRRPVQWGPSTAKKDKDYNAQNKSQITNASSNACIGVAVVPVVFCIDVCVGRDEELAQVHVTFLRRQMQWGVSTEKKTRITTLKTNPKSQTHVQMRVKGWLSYG